jgi:predicted MFS family arabinose efflux permease
VWGPLVFGPLFADRALAPADLALPWLLTSLFALGGLLISFGVRPDPQELSRAFVNEAGAAPEPESPATVRELLRRPGVGYAMLAAVTSFAVMAGVMNLAGYVAVGHHHKHGAIFTVISAHIVGMYGLVLIVGDLVERIGRRRAMTAGLVIMAASNLSLVWLSGIAGMSLSMFGLGLGWNISYVAATTELVSLAAPSERGRLVGLSDRLSSFSGASLALGGGIIYSAGGVTPLAILAALTAGLPAACIVLLPSGVGGQLVRRFSVTASKL